MSSRRDFIKQASALVVAGCMAPDLVVSATKSAAERKVGDIRAVALNLSSDVVRQIPEGANMVVLYLDNHILWNCHPEVSSESALSPESLRSMLKALRDKGIEPIPAVNFSAAHDMWMGKYSRMLSSGPYYRFCKDIIAESIDMFDRPRFIHFGMQEEGWEKQQCRDRIVYRQDMLWWSDLYLYISEAMSRCVRPWVWADTMWKDPDKFLTMMPKNVIQSNWSRTGSFSDASDASVQAFAVLDSEGFDQVPAIVPESTGNPFHGCTVDYCCSKFRGEHLLGFISDSALYD